MKLRSMTTRAMLAVLALLLSGSAPVFGQTATRTFAYTHVVSARADCASVLEYFDAQNARRAPRYVILLSTQYDAGEPVQIGDLVAIEWGDLGSEFPQPVDALGTHLGVPQNFPLSSTAIGWVGSDEVDYVLAAFCNQP